MTDCTFTIELLSKILSQRALSVTRAGLKPHCCRVLALERQIPACYLEAELEVILIHTCVSLEKPDHTFPAPPDFT